MDKIQKIYVGVPCYTPQISMRFANSLLSLVGTTVGTPIEINLNFIIGQGYIGKARNEMASSFLESDNDVFLQIDNDILFTPADVQRIVSHNKPVVGGFYFKKDLGKRIAVAERLLEQTGPDENGLIEVKYIGAGFLAVRREVLERMIQEWGLEPWFWYANEGNGRKYHDFFPAMVHPRLNRWLGEDWWFCQRARDLGYKVYGDSQVRLPHLGMVTYPVEQPAAHPMDI